MTTVPGAGPLDPAPAPVALAEPTVPVTRLWVAGLTLATVGVFAAFFGPIQVLLAQHSEQVAPGNKEFVFGLVTGAGAAVSMVATPLFGALSDRTTSRFGRRVPWVAAGAVGGAVGLLALAGAEVVALMVLAWCLVQGAANAMLAATSAAVPDRAPDRQRGSVGGWLALGQTIGALAGVGIASATGDFRVGYFVCAGFLLVMVVPYLLRSEDVVLPGELRPPLAWRSFLKGFWVSPRRYPDFGWAWITRFLVQLSNSIGTLYLYFYLKDEVGYHDPEGGVLILLLIYSVFVVLTSLSSGWMSDKVGRRKAFVTWSGVVMAGAAVVLVVWPTWSGVVVGAVVLGLGFGVFTSVDFAIMTEVLPKAADRGKDLGVINIANALPQVLAPAVAAPIITWLGGYPTLYLVAAVIGLAGAVLVRNIRCVP
jgi:MFS family permease